MLCLLKNFILRRKFILNIFVAVVWIGIWQVFYIAVGREILITSPLNVLTRLFELILQPRYHAAVLMSVARVLAGFAIGLFAGIILAAATAKNMLLDCFFRPAISIIRATPVASFILIALVWMRTGHVPVLTAALIVLPVVWANVSEGIRKTDKPLLEMGQVYRFGFIKTVRLIYFPSVLPYFTAAFATSLGMAWKAGIAAEVISNPRLAIGANLRDSRMYIDTEGLFAWTVVVIIVSMIIEKLLIRLLKLFHDR